MTKKLKVPKLTHSPKKIGPTPSRIEIPVLDEESLNVVERTLGQKNGHRGVSYDWTMVSDKLRKAREFSIEVPNTEIPAVLITVPDSWPYVRLAPLYDVHIGSKEMDGAKFVRDITWLAKEPYTLTWNGGDLWDNAVSNSIASSFSDDQSPNEQYDTAQSVMKLLLSKIIFAVPGNHEDRTSRYADMDVAKILNENLGIPYSPDYILCTIKWRGKKFRICATHGTGAAASPGGQRNAARRDMPWLHSCDLYWTGHLHQALVDQIEVIYFNQNSDLPTSKTVYTIISPSYLKYFGGYAAKKRLSPGMRGLTVVTLRDDGRMDVESHANGERL